MNAKSIISSTGVTLFGKKPVDVGSRKNKRPSRAATPVKLPRAPRSALTREQLEAEEDYRGLKDVRDLLLLRFGNQGLDQADISYFRKIDTFDVVLFYARTEQFVAGEFSGLNAQIEEAVIEELEKVGRGKRGRSRIVYEWNSCEVVKAEYGGSHFNWLMGRDPKTALRIREDPRS